MASNRSNAAALLAAQINALQKLVAIGSKAARELNRLATRLRKKVRTRKPRRTAIKRAAIKAVPVKSTAVKRAPVKHRAIKRGTAVRRRGSVKRSA